MRVNIEPFGFPYRSADTIREDVFSWDAQTLHVFRLKSDRIDSNINDFSQHSPLASRLKRGKMKFPTENPRKPGNMNPPPGKARLVSCHVFQRSSDRKRGGGANINADWFDLIWFALDRSALELSWRGCAADEEEEEEEVVQMQHAEVVALQLQAVRASRKAWDPKIQRVGDAVQSLRDHDLIPHIVHGCHVPAQLRHVLPRSRCSGSPSSGADVCPPERLLHLHSLRQMFWSLVIKHQEAHSKYC